MCVLFFFANLLILLLNIFFQLIHSTALFSRSRYALKIRYSIIEHMLFVIGALVLSSRMGRLTGSLDYNSIIPNKYVAIIFIVMGLSVMSIYFDKPRKQKMILLNHIFYKNSSNLSQTAKLSLISITL